LTEVYLLTLDAQGYFESFGFAVIDRERVPAEVAASREFDSICPATATAMVLQLSGGQSAVKACREKGRHT
jgi:amino-acid N-acetyltransferase